MGRPAPYEQLLRKQEELIEALTWQVERGSRVREAALELHKYYHERASAINKVVLGEEIPLSAGSDYMDILEDNVRRYVAQSTKEVAALRGQLALLK